MRFNKVANAIIDGTENEYGCLKYSLDTHLLILAEVLDEYVAGSVDETVVLKRALALFSMQHGDHTGYSPKHPS